MTGYESKRAAAQDKLVVTDIDGHVVRDARKPKKAQPAQEPWPEEPFGHMAGGVQPAQEPVAWAVVGDGKFGEYELGQVFVDYEATHIYWKNRGYELVPVYTTPPQRPWVMQREWVDLTEDEIDKWAHELHGVIYAVMAELKEKNNG